jgi:hypothetical protein
MRRRCYRYRCRHLRHPGLIERNIVGNARAVGVGRLRVVRTLSKTSRRVPRLKPSARSWVTIKTVIRVSLHSWSSSACISLRIPGSSAPKGSSSSRTAAASQRPGRSPAAAASRRTAAPDIYPGRGRAHFLQHLCRLFAGSALAGAKQTAKHGEAGSSRPMVTLSSTLRCGKTE